MRRLLPLSALLIPSLAAAIPITGYTLLLPGQPVTDVLHDVADAGDLDMDGLNDQALGDPLFTPAGSVSIRYGGPPPFPGLVPPAQILGSLPGDGFGTAVDGVGDVNCDGFPDLVVGAPGAFGTGAAYVFLGPILPGVYPAASANLILLGEAIGDRAGTSVQLLPDMDFDGCAEIGIGAPGHDPTSSLPDAGTGYIVFSGSGFGGLVPLNPATAMTYRGDVPGENLGYAVDKAGDFDTNSLEDFLLGSPGYATTGAARIALNPFRTWSAGLSGTAITPVAVTLVGELPGDRAGFSVDGGDDVDGDGRPDILVGAPGHTVPGGTFMAGAAYLVSGAATPPVPGFITPLPPVAEKRFGTWQTGQLGFDVSFFFDLNGDGFGDWAASEPFAGSALGGQGRTLVDLSPGPIMVGTTLPWAGPSVDAVTNFMGVGFAIDGGQQSDFTPGPDPIIGFYFMPASRNGLATF